MKKKKMYLFILIGLIAVFILQAGIFYFIMRARALNDRPLVLIHTPFPEQQISLQSGAILHATARSAAGLERVEFWADDLLISSEEPASDDPDTILLLTENWVPLTSGTHNLIVRAYSKSGVAGQSSIELEVLDGISTETARYVVQEGDTLDSIAQANQTTAQAILENNGGVDLTNLEPGEELNIPSSGSGGSPRSFTEVSDSGVEPPGAAASEPGSLQTLNIFWPMDIFTPPAEPVQLMVEINGLQTRSSFESLHCYVGLASSTPRWMPDTDGNPATDETFFSTGNLGIDWDVYNYLGGEHALRVYWDGNQSVPISINCIGITGGGLIAVDLGEILEQVEPNNWGVLQSASSQNGEDIFTLTYRVTWPEKGPDTGMTPPWNLQLDEDRQMLTWDYLPDVGGNPAVNGFALFLNDTLQWTVDGSQHATRIPEQWLTIPCGDEYLFTLVAYNGDYPSGTYSLPSDPFVVSGDEVGSEGCGHSVMITFVEFITGDASFANAPVYGTFFANYNDQLFDGRSIQDDNFPYNLQFVDGSHYQISRILDGFGTGEPRIVMELPQDQGYPLAVGFEIYQSDHKVCAGIMFLSEDQLAGPISDVVFTDTPVGIQREACSMSFTVSTVGEAPTVNPGDEPPLPDLTVESLSVDPETERLVINIRNTGNASWLNQDLRLNIISSNNGTVNTYQLRNFTLNPGEKTALSREEFTAQPPMSVCVLLDPYNEVTEQYDRVVENGMLGPKAPYCPPLPDLSITEVSYNPETAKLQVTVKNQGEATLFLTDSDGIVNHEDLTIKLSNFSGHSGLSPIQQTFEDVNMGVRETRVFSVDISPDQRENMLGGYDVSINSEKKIAELDYENNTYNVPGTDHLLIVWSGQSAIFCPTNHFLLNGEEVSGDNTWDMQLKITIQGGSSHRMVADWNSAEMTFDWVHFYGDLWCNGFDTGWFDVAGDEEVVISRTAELDIQYRGFRWFSGGAETLSAANNYGGTTLVDGHLDPNCFADMVPVTSHVSGGIGDYYCGTGSGCTTEMSPDGIRDLGVIYASSDDITGDCWWSTTYRVFQKP